VRLAEHIKEVPDRIEHSAGQLLSIITDDTTSNYSMTWELQLTLETLAIECSELRNYIPCMANVIQLCLGVLMSNHGVKSCTKTWEAQECNKQFDENEGIPTTNIQKLRKFRKVQIYKVAARNPRLAKIIEMVTIS
jgi:hypothetical protein